LPTWGEILEELTSPENQTPGGAPDFDKVRRSYLAKLAAKTGRATILYAAGFLDQPDIPGAVTQVELGDKQGFMNAVAGLPQQELDLILTSPGGSAEATEAILTYLRTRFAHIRVIVPVAAMSAATMLALGADEIMMGKHSQLGPIDPQFFIMTPEGPRFAPAAEILEQFEMAKKECQDPANLAAWAPILRSYAPGLLAQCVTSRQLAETMVARWLKEYMLKGQPDAEDVANAAAKWFADYRKFGSHGRSVTLDDLLALRLRATRLESDQELQDLVLSVHHATSHTFSLTSAAKIIENHRGRAFIRMRLGVDVPPAPATPKPPTPGPTNSPPATDRAARRRASRGR
jgi:hypothetical protein